MTRMTIAQKKKVQQIKEIRKIAVWAVSLVLLTGAVSIGVTFFSSAFGIEDKASAVELCSFDLPKVESFEDIRTVTAGNGRHVFLAESLDSNTGDRNGLYMYEEGTPSDPCLGIKPISIKIGDNDYYDISSAQVYMYDWDLLNAVYIPDVYTENTEDGYIVLFLREDTNSYEKEMVAITLEYKTGKLSYKNMMSVFPGDPNFTSIVDLHYSFETSSLYVFGVSDSEGFKSRGIRTAGIGYEDLLQGRPNFSYCSTDANNVCNWTSDYTEADITIDAMKGDLDVLGVEDSLSLMLQNKDGKLMIYDLAAAGTFWNPGLRLLNCEGYVDCGKIVTYDYQASYFENPEESIEIMTFYFLQSDGKLVHFYEGKVDDYTIKDEKVAELLAPKVVFAKFIAESSVSSTKKYSSSAKVVSKTRSSAPKSDNQKSKVQAVIKKAPAAKATTKSTSSKEVKKVGYVVVNPKKKATTKVTVKKIAEKVLKKESSKEDNASVEVARVKSSSKTSTVAVSATEDKKIKALKADKKVTKTTKAKDAVITETPQNSLTAAEKRLVQKLECGANEIVDDIGACIPIVPENPRLVSFKVLATPDKYGGYENCPGDNFQKPDGECVDINDPIQPDFNCLNEGILLTINGKPVCQVTTYLPADCPQVMYDSFGTKVCLVDATKNEPVAESVDLVANESTSCEYGASGNSQYCQDRLPNCASNSGSCYTGGPMLYAANAKCISQGGTGTIKSCCPPGMKKDTWSSKCVQFGTNTNADGSVYQIKVGTVLGDDAEDTDVQAKWEGYIRASLVECKSDWNCSVNENLVHPVSRQCVSPKSAGATSVYACCSSDRKEVDGKCVLK